MGDGAAQIPGIGWESLTLSFASLGVVCLVGVGDAAAARWARCREGIGRDSRRRALPLEPRRSVFVIETAGRCFLVGVGDGPMALLAELDADKLPKPQESAGTRFTDVLARVLRRNDQGAPAAPNDRARPPSSR